MIRPQRAKPPNPVALSQPVVPVPTPETVVRPKVQSAQATKAKPPRTVIPRDPDGTEYRSVKYGSDGPCPMDGCREVGPHHHTTLRVSQDTEYATIGPSLFQNFRLLKRLLEEGLKGNGKDPAD